MQDAIRGLIQENKSKLVLCVLDGLGGLPVNGKSELEAAEIPNLDKLAKHGAAGLHTPVAVGITPGSGAAHLGLFGYDPLSYEIGRGVLEAIGIGIEVGASDIAIRGNFATVSYAGASPIVTDRRAGRISTEENQRITAKIRENLGEIGGARVSVTSGLEHRIVILLSFPNPLPAGADDIPDTDPQREGKSPRTAAANKPQALPVAEAVNKTVSRIAEIIRDEPKANYILLRGVSQYPNLAGFKEVYGLRAAAIATYPMYRGVAKLVGMDALEVRDNSIESEIETLARHFDEYDFFYLHVKKTDSYGEDGNFEGKARVIEQFDELLPRILNLKPDVLAITGDHSTPAIMKSHSWHPVPIVIASPYACGGWSEGFSERECLKGELGRIRAVEIMPLMLAHAGRLQKFGA
ncbi:MAG: 2,3-bisphosphoglycerate-independent phosphoglycerate mutase [Deltaproteobacteria bacterium]